jgi:serine/threonine-protein kinase RsbW
MITMAFPGRFSSLDAIRNFYADAAEQAGLDKESIADIELAVDEAACNIIDHAYGGEGKGEIECSYRVIPEGLEVILHDHGKPFDPETVVEPDLVSDVCCREPGGLGLHFMKSLMDSVKFSFNGHGGNLLTMTKLQKKAFEP